VFSAINDKITADTEINTQSDGTQKKTLILHDFTAHFL